MGEKTLEKVKAGAGLLEKIELAVPGFKGYKEKEMRREADRLVREFVHSKLERAKRDAKAAYSELVDREAAEAWADVDHAIAEVDRLSQEILHATHGYSGFFDAVKVREKELDALMEFDSKLIENANGIQEVSKLLKEESEAGNLESVEKHLDDLQERIDGLDEALTERKNLMTGVGVE